MPQKIFMLVPLFVLLAGYMGAAQSADASAASARVRVYQEADITLYPGEYCYGSDRTSVIQNSRGGFSIFNFGKRTGMPETNDIAGSYDEYVIPAGKAISVRLKWEGEKDGVKLGCGPIGSTFYPQAGKSYDITLGFAGSCFVQIRELHEISPGKASAVVTPSSFSYACANQ